MGSSIAALVTTTAKNKKLLERLIISLCAQSRQIEKVIIVYDGTLRPDKREFEQCPLSISWIDNRNFQSLTLLQNKAIESSKEDLILLLNDDVILEISFVEELVQAINNNDSIGMVCGKLMRMDKITIDTAGQLLGNKRTPVERGYGSIDTGEFEKPEYVFGSCGAAVLLRRTMLEDCAISKNEYFDNDYNMFYEDLDLSWRAANSGWKAFYTPRAVGFHHRGATAKEKKPIFEFLRPYNFVWLKSSLKSDVIKNRCMTIIKNETLKDFLLNIHNIFIYDIKIFLYCLIFDPAVILQNIKHLPVILKAFKKRKALKKNR